MRSADFLGPPNTEQQSHRRTERELFEEFKSENPEEDCKGSKYLQMHTN